MDQALSGDGLAEGFAGSLYNRKNPHPSESMRDAGDARYRCGWIEDSITIHSDGNVSCGPNDPHGQRSFGNIYSQSVAEIFANPEYANLQDKLWRGSQCLECGQFRAETKPSAAINPRPHLPNRLMIETAVTCNIRCANAACLPNNDPLMQTRNANLLDFEKFKAAIDQVAPGIKTVVFFNYGEPFMHRRAEDMLLYLRARCPQAFVVTSTNGIPLHKPERARKVVEAQLNRITFTIGGFTQESYERYHARGRLDMALAGMRNVCTAKRDAGHSVPQVVWRYLVFDWNDSDREIDAAIAHAKEIGVDCFSLYLTNTPKEARSIKFSPGSPSFWKYRGYIHLDDEGELNQIYKGELPDRSGLYQIKERPLLGPSRWTSSRARFWLSRRNDELWLALATNRQKSAARGERCIVYTAWGQYEVFARHGGWRRATIPVPPAFRAYNTFEVELEVPDCWYPAAETDAAKDLRCLGVLVKAEQAATAPTSPRALALPAGFDPLIWGQNIAIPGGVALYPERHARRPPTTSSAQTGGTSLRPQ